MQFEERIEKFVSKKCFFLMFQIQQKMYECTRSSVTHLHKETQ